ncbi:hypothetical protein EI94DRAFT_386295 [Lactarius quietus]|nr:hypothetical protein EI94DRAFT_386295 [Lactarius quietus]
MAPSQPAWQTDELQDEWPDEAQSGDDDLHTRSISLTVPVSPQLADVDVLGTFLIRQDVPSPISRTRFLPPCP